MIVNNVILILCPKPRNTKFLCDSFIITISTSDIDVKQSTYKETPTVTDWPGNEYEISDIYHEVFVSTEYSYFL